MPDTPKNNTSRSSASRLAEVVSSVLKPLLFASKDAFRHLNSVKGIENLVSTLSSDAESLGAGEAESAVFAELKALFSGFDDLAVEEKKERLRKGVSLAHSIGAPEKTPAVTAEEASAMLKKLKTPLEFVKGIGPKLAERLGKKGLTTVEDMLYFLPIRYEDRRYIIKIKELTPGASTVTTGTVVAQGETRYGRRKVYEMAVSDGSAILKVKWFNYKLSYMSGRFKTGQRLMLYGVVSSYGHQKEMIHPDIEAVDADETEQIEQGIVPVYSQIENFHQKTIRKIVSGVVEGYSESAVGGLPDGVVERCGLLGLKNAFREAHLPAAFDASLAKKSLVFDELFLLELGLALKRRELKRERGIAFSSSAGGRFEGIEDKLRRLLPFRLTAAQEKVYLEIKNDMESPHPMNRLIQGDVGSGKTIVSLMAALKAVEAGYQAAIMAPTEILSEQHYLTTHRYAEALGVKPLLLTGNMTKGERKAGLELIREGGVDLVVGTHALIQKDVDFSKLGLIVIDEQHRFGVVQRAALKKKGFGSENEIYPDILIMTATPIPRTLSMTVFGDLDVSIIDELPPGRKPVHTKILREADRVKAYEIIRKEVVEGSQCYIVYPLVEESEELSLRDATRMQEHLRKDIFKEFKVGLLHGRMKSSEKESVMRGFKERRLDILVSTTVIEVGVDVPNATVMLVEHAERFGLAQLHQLRGRVGRGEKKSICLLLAAWTNAEDTYKRLKVMEATQDGFKIAEEDLSIRGPGDFLGTRQAGLPDFRTSEALTNLTLLKRAREEADRFLEADPALKSAEAGRIKLVLKARWEGRLELAEIG
ncbi:MAG: ATP-dependent DNA helicase RecG [Deltaproteobacteria bacterium]|nr:ATP-dependent DNA helicase RecG [Deltaproteobacteria bacterium]